MVKAARFTGVTMVSTGASGNDVEIPQVVHSQPPAGFSKNDYGWSNAFGFKF